MNDYIMTEEHSPSTSSSFVDPDKKCVQCGTSNTPLWRRGPKGPKTLCNSCGIHWSRGLKKKSYSQKSSGSSKATKKSKTATPRIQNNTIVHFHDPSSAEDDYEHQYYSSTSSPFSSPASREVLSDAYPTAPEDNGGNEKETLGFTSSLRTVKRPQRYSFQDYSASSSHSYTTGKSYLRPEQDDIAAVILLSLAQQAA